MLSSIRHLASCDRFTFIIPLVVVITFGVAADRAPADDELAAGAAQETITQVIVGHRGATEMAKLLSNQLRANNQLQGGQVRANNQVTVTADVHTNALIVRGRKAAVTGVAELLRDLDTSFRTVFFKVTIAVSGEGTESRLLDELELSTLDNNKAKLQFGQQVAVSTGTQSFGGSRGTSRTYSQQSVGTLVQIQPRIAGDQILTELQIEKSWLQSPPQKSDSEIPTPRALFNTSVDTTLALQDEKPRTIRIKAMTASGGQREVIITLTASLEASSLPRDASKKSSSPLADRGPKRTPPAGFRPGGFSADRPAAGGRTRPTMNSGARTLFQRFDNDQDQVISKSEWTSNPMSKVFATRGFIYSDDMDLKLFEETMMKMVSSLRRTPESKESPGRSDSKEERKPDSAQETDLSDSVQGNK